MAAKCALEEAWPRINAPRTRCRSNIRPRAEKRYLQAAQSSVILPAAEAIGLWAHQVGCLSPGRQSVSHQGRS